MTQPARHEGVRSVPAVDAAVRAAEVAARIDRVRALAAVEGSRGAWLGSRRDTAWLTLGGELHVVLESEDAIAPIVVLQDRVVVLAPVNEADRLADEELSGLPVEIVPIPWHENPEAAAGRVLGDAATAKPLLRGAALERVMELERSRLGAIEHERLRWLGSVTQAALSAAADIIRPGRERTETEVASALVGIAARQGVRTPVVLAAADDRIARYRHPLPADRSPRRRLMVVLVTERWGLHAAGTVIVDVQAPDAETARRDAAVGRVLAAMAEATSPGVTLGSVLEATRDAYTAEGFGAEWELHHQGGTIGYRGRERIAVPDDPFVLEAGMAVAWNPSITGAKAESTLLLGPETGGAGAGRAALEVIVPPLHLAAMSEAIS